MISIQEKINLFKQELKLRIEKEKEEELKKIKKFASEQKSDYSNRLEKEIGQIEKKYTRLETRKVNQIIAEANTNKKELLQNLNKEIKENFFETILEESKSYLDSKIYYNYYVKSLEDLKKSINDTKNIKFFTKKEDLDRFKNDIKDILEDHNIEFEELDPKQIGGFLVYDDGERFKFDYTLLELFNENKKEIDRVIRRALDEGKS